jgi:predicted extracellular nuclease
VIQLALARAILVAVVATAAAVLMAGSIRAAPAELLLSEYVEGSGNNKALELYNGTGADVTLTGSYSVQLFANGSATATATIPLTGSVADGDVFVLARSQPFRSSSPGPIRRRRISSSMETTPSRSSRTAR